MMLNLINLQIKDYSTQMERGKQLHPPTQAFSSARGIMDAVVERQIHVKDAVAGTDGTAMEARWDSVRVDSVVGATRDSAVIQIAYSFVLGALIPTRSIQS